jgi:hypothetical protein
MRHFSPLPVVQLHPPPARSVVMSGQEQALQGVPLQLRAEKLWKKRPKVAFPPVGLGPQKIMHTTYMGATANLMFDNARKP